MAMTYLLDSNAWIGYLRGTDQALIQKVQQTPPTEICLCSVVMAELYYGAYHGSPTQLPANLALLARLCQRFVELPFEHRASEEYGKIRADLARKGMPIGPNDYMIAAIACAGGLTLVTHNTGEFGRVSGLKLEDWQTP